MNILKKILIGLVVLTLFGALVRAPYRAGYRAGFKDAQRIEQLDNR